MILTKPLQKLIKVNKLLCTLFLLIIFAINTFAQCPGVAEIRGNGIDDDCDGLIDCFDPDCFNSNVCEDFYYGQPEPTCMETPKVEYKFNLVEQWRSAVTVEARITPFVGDLDGDGFPEVITSFATVVAPFKQGYTYILDGRDGSVKYQINVDINMYQHSVGIADVDRDGFGEIFLVDKDRYLRCFNHDGTVKAGFTPYRIGTGTDNVSYESTPHPAFVDFDGDGNVEIYLGAQIFNSRTGALIAQAAGLANAPKGAVGATSSQHRFPVAYDVLPDGYCADCSGAELIAGNVVYSVNIATGTLTVASKFSQPLWAQGGTTAIADWKGDEQMDVIVFGIHGGGAVYIWDPRTTKLITTDTGGNPLEQNPYLKK